ncbi:MAG: polysaccharide deacetylase family protein [Flavobacteriaceae bacterium]
MKFIENQIIKYKGSSLRIVYYHIISDSNPEHYFSNKALSIKNFRNHIRFFKQNYDIITLDEALHLSSHNETLKNKLVITFDDGFKENYSIIAPILDEEKISATFFIISSCIDNADLMWRNKILLFEKYKKGNIAKIIDDISRDFKLKKPTKKQDILQWSFEAWPMDIKEKIVNKLWHEIMPYQLEEYLQETNPYCSAKEIKELSDAGFGIGSHSHTHPIFSRLNYKDFSYEISKSTDILTSIIEKEISSFSYPFGVRSNAELENQFCIESSKKWTFLGTKNRLNNYVNNYDRWERDNIEYSNLQMKLRFLYLPLYRSLILK